jgi:plasmid stabilization system protein ParE
MKASVLEPTVKDLYEQDFFEWTARDAELLRAGRFAEADLEHIAEEIEDMGKSERRELRTRLRVLLSHLLKWKFQPSRRGRSWRATIRVQRDELTHLLQQMPSLRRYLRGQLPDVYPVAVEGAIAETDLMDETFPPACPFSLDQILDANFFPD